MLPPSVTEQTVIWC